MHPYFLKIDERFDLKDWDRADFYTKEMLHWVPDLFQSLKKVYCLFYLIWPDSSVVDEVPTGYDIYVLHTGTEYLSWEWVQNFCQRFRDSQVVLICPYDRSLYSIDNLKILEYALWPQILSTYIQEYSPGKIKIDHRRRKLSSLCNRINEARAYITAHIYRTWDPSDYVISWRGQLGKPNDLYFLEKCGINRIDDLKGYIADHFINLDIRPDGDFVNQAMANLFVDWSPFNNCLINCSNESVSVSHYQDPQGRDNILPGPYLTEKTWKSLLSGTALLPVGQYHTYRYLEKFGFQFDYPWDRGFDDVPEDFDRFMLIFDQLDQIKDMEMGFLDSSTRDSRAHNQDHIFSGQFEKVSQSINEKNLSEFKI